MYRGRLNVAGVFAVILLLLLSVPGAFSPSSEAQAGQWTVTISIQLSVNTGISTMSMSGSGSATLVANAGVVTGSGTFRGSITMTVSPPCSGGGTLPFSETDAYTGQITDTTTNNATITVTSSGSTAPSSMTITCPSSAPPPPTYTTTAPVPSAMASAAGTYRVLLKNGYSRVDTFSAPVSGQATLTVTGGTTTTSSTSSTVHTSSISSSATSTSLIDERLDIYAMGDPSLVEVCDAGWNNCRQPARGEILQPGECIRTLSQATPNGIAGGLLTLMTIDEKMEVMMSPNAEFCVPTSSGTITSIYDLAHSYYQAQGDLGWTEEYLYGPNIHILTPFVALDPTGTQFAVRTSSAGTTVVVMAGSVVVTELRSNNSVTVVPGQTITVKNASSGMSMQEMMQGVSAFDMSAMDQWWSPLLLKNATTSIASSSAESSSPLSFLPSSDTVEFALAAVFVLIVVVVVAAVSRGRRSTSPTQ